MVKQVLAPGVQHRDYAGLGAEMPGIGAMLARTNELASWYA